MNSYTTRYRTLTRQHAYQREIRASGIRALLAPYTLRTPSVPRQRTKSAERLPGVGISG